jgi:hypothetical protein
MYFWEDDIHFGTRMEDASQCMLVLVVIGATKHRDKELLTILMDTERERAILAGAL